MPFIRSVKANVTRDEAIRQFSGQGFSGMVRKLILGRLRSVAELYVPFRLFRVRITNDGVTDEKLVALDAISGSLDLFQFDRMPDGAEMVSLETRNCPAAVLPDSVLTERVVAKLRRVLYSRGFFKMRDLRLDALPLPDELHIPYWIGFRGTDDRVRISVIDAVRRRPEGAKVRRLVEEWLSKNLEKE